MRAAVRHIAHLSFTHIHTHAHTLIPSPSAMDAQHTLYFSRNNCFCLEGVWMWGLLRAQSLLSAEGGSRGPSGRCVRSLARSLDTRTSSVNGEGGQEGDIGRRRGWGFSLLGLLCNAILKDGSSVEDIILGTPAPGKKMCPERVSLPPIFIDFDCMGRWCILTWPNEHLHHQESCNICCMSVVHFAQNWNWKCVHSIFFSFIVG